MVLVVDNFDSFTYNLVQLLGELGQEVRVYRNNEITPQEAEALAPDHVVISPGPCTPNEAGASIEIIRRLAGKVPILGVCLGHQCVGQAFGGRIVRAAQLMHGKTSEILHDGRTVFSGLPQGFQATRYHSLAVERESVPECFEISARTADGEIMGLRHKELEVEGVQFHPESVATPLGRKLVENFLKRTKQGASVDLRSAIARVVDGQNLDREEMESVMDIIMSGEATQAQIGAFITALRLKGETVEEISAAASVMRAKATRVKVPADRIIVDTCGTGGDGTHTFNISTAAALVAAGAGVTIAKHGNRSVSSKCGSADVLAELGVNIAIDADKMAECLEKAGIGFLFAPALHSAMKHVIGPRREVGIRTVFNILGPLSNPALATAQVLGVYDPELVPVMARVLSAVGVRKAIVVHGSDGLDEITLTGKTTAAFLDNGVVSQGEIDPKDLGLPLCSPDDLTGGDAVENARILRAILSGEERGPRRNIVVLNAAAALVVGEAAADLQEAITKAAAAIDNGAAAAALSRLIEVSNA